MKKLNKTDALNEAIKLLEAKQAIELKELTNQFSYTYESLKPVNLVKTTLNQVSNSAEIKGNLMSNIIGITTGFLSKKILFGSSINPIKRGLGTILQYAITNVVSKNADPIKSSLGTLMQKIFSKNKSDGQYSENGIGV
jgi:hypothetical protein